MFELKLKGNKEGVVKVALEYVHNIEMVNVDQKCKAGSTGTTVLDIGLNEDTSATIKIKDNMSVTRFEIQDTDNVVEEVSVEGAEDIVSLNSSCMQMEGLKRFSITETPILRDIFRAWDGCINLEEFEYVKFTDIEEGDHAFRNCRKLKEMGDLDLSRANDVTSVFRNCFKIKKIGIINISKAEYIYNLLEECRELEEVTLITGKPRYLCAVLKNCASLKQNPLSNVDLSLIEEQDDIREVFDGTKFEGTKLL